MTLIDSLKAYEEGLRKASEIIVETSPDYIIAPMMGAVPFIDVMHILNDSFDPEKVYYMPASSHIADVSGIMKNWMKNFLKKNVTPEKPVILVSIDEVVSGNSAVRVSRSIDEAINQRNKELVSIVLQTFNVTDNDAFEGAANYLNQLTDSKNYDFFSQLITDKRDGVFQKDMPTLRTSRNLLTSLVRDYFENHIRCVGLGIEDSKATDRRNKEYKELIETKRMVPVPVKTILTMDHPKLCPAVYKQIADKGHVRFSPEVDRFEVSQEYIIFLQNIAKIAGRNPNLVAPINMGRILESSDYL